VHYTFIKASSRSINHDTFSVPRLVLSLLDLLPVRQDQIWDVYASRKRPLFVFREIGAYEFDLDTRHVGAFGDRAPSAARDA
jgi:hypothetical protein